MAAKKAPRPALLRAGSATGTEGPAYSGSTASCAFTHAWLASAVAPPAMAPTADSCAMDAKKPPRRAVLL